MLYWLTALSDGGDLFNLFRYVTFRAGGAFRPMRSSATQ